MNKKSLIIGVLLGIVFGAASVPFISQWVNQYCYATNMTNTTTTTTKENKVSENNIVKIKLATGIVTMELYPDVAPKTVESFKKLISQGFYDGLTFHRVIPGFMAQGGDPDGTGMGGPGFKVKAEFNDKKHVRGTLAMARSADPDSAGSQFYICFAAQPHLDGQYTIFGQVIDGMELIDGVKNGTVMEKLTIEASGE